MKRNTLDLDRISLEDMYYTIEKIMRCKDLRLLETINDTHKGYHLTLWCKENCDLCRFVFDDPERFSRDLKREVHTRDVLFNEKIYRPVR